MSVYQHKKNRIYDSIAYSTLTIVILFAISGCIRNYGQFVRNPEVDQDFYNGNYKPNYQYFYAGRDTMPYAIIGIDRNYTVSSRFWIPIEPETERIREISRNIYGAQHYYPTGSQILAQDGTLVGVWFSSVFNKSVRVDQQNRTVEVLFKNPENNRSQSAG